MPRIYITERERGVLEGILLRFYGSKEHSLKEGELLRSTALKLEKSAVDNDIDNPKMFALEHHKQRGTFAELGLVGSQSYYFKGSSTSPTILSSEVLAHEVRGDLNLSESFNVVRIDVER